jgi:type IV secretory pathway VirJ component
VRTYGAQFGLAAVLLLLPAASQVVAPPEIRTIPPFGTVTIFPPEGTPDTVVLFVSGDGGWNLGVVSMAQRLRGLGALVVGIDIRTFLMNQEASSSCAYPAGPLEELSRAVQVFYKLPEYRKPILAGYSSGATLVYAALAAAPPETFAGAISLGFCPDLEIHRSLCEMGGLKATKKAYGVGYDLAPFAGLTVPWFVLQGEADQVCAPSVTRAFVSATGSARLFLLPKVGHGFGVPHNWDAQFVEAYRSIARANTGATGPGTGSPVGYPPVVVSPVRIGSPGRDLMAVILTGDGGWAEIDKSIAAGLATAGVPSVGWDSLRYYWTPRTPEGAAADLSRIIRHYSALWGTNHVLLVGYSFGADVLPFLVNRLPSDLQAKVKNITLLGPSDTAAFEFHISSWFGGGGEPRYPTVPEINRLTPAVACVYGADERDSPCLRINATRVAVSVGKGHHFGGNYKRLVQIILR